MRRLVPLCLLLLAAACRPYERYGYVTSERGLMEADKFASYGPDQASAVAIGREYGKGFAGLNPTAYARQADAAVTYARKMPQVRTIVVDTLGHRLVVTFASGWTAQITPIMDGKSGDETPGLPKH
ncbi:MAG TPA: hypothetical protein VHW65_07640 [Gemmatimonadales bacterium]|jgi:hypothetical protein|nr:hypothetical protein [Gemmatimonadales bacterium]